MAVLWDKVLGVDCHSQDEGKTITWALGPTSHWRLVGGGQLQEWRGDAVPVPAWVAHLPAHRWTLPLAVAYSLGVAAKRSEGKAVADGG